MGSELDSSSSSCLSSSVSEWPKGRARAGNNTACLGRPFDGLPMTSCTTGVGLSSPSSESTSRGDLAERGKSPLRARPARDVDAIVDEGSSGTRLGSSSRGGRVRLLPSLLASSGLGFASTSIPSSEALDCVLDAGSTLRSTALPEKPALWAEAAGKWRCPAFTISRSLGEELALAPFPAELVPRVAVYASPAGSSARRMCRRKPVVDKAIGFGPKFVRVPGPEGDSLAAKVSPAAETIFMAKLMTSAGMATFPCWPPGDRQSEDDCANSRTHSAT
mmetsp:Transcript_18358/g.47039  ORF Transcript_18358/g.47039 Transcript_18358/m.47039 type:complete len:276 (-) Transcript_18358:2088-2915(-)